MDYAAYWHLPRLFNPDNFLGVPEDIFPGIVSVNVLCIPNEVQIEVPGGRRVESATDTWRK
jgi:hypothetical protein